MLFTAYSAGLRVSEIVNLKVKDIDSTRMQIFIERAKGKKDRYVNLSPVLLDILPPTIQNPKITYLSLNKPLQPILQEQFNKYFQKPNKKRAFLRM